MSEVGIDIIEIERIRYAIARWSEKFRDKVFSPSEVEYCESRPNPAQHFAVRFAAKEAVAKAIKSSADVFLKWRDVEIIANNNGAPKVVLHGEAEKLFGSSKISLSVSHSNESAVAVALLTSDPN